MVRSSAYASAIAALITVASPACVVSHTSSNAAVPAAAEIGAGTPVSGPSATDAAAPAEEPRSTRAGIVLGAAAREEPVPAPSAQNPHGLTKPSPALLNRLAHLQCADADVACKAFTLQAPAVALPPRSGEVAAHRVGHATLVLNAWQVERERRCLAHAGYAEARNQGPLGMLAVMWVVANRVALSKTPTTPCGVIVSKGALEAIWKPGYRTLRQTIAAGYMPADLVIAEPAKPGTKAARKSAQTEARRRGVLTNVIEQRAYETALLLAYEMVDGPLDEEDPTGGATLYWSPTAQSALDRAPPAWRSNCVKTAKLGLHEFYRKLGQASTLVAEVR